MIELFDWSLLQQNNSIIMFISAFLSSTLLSGNSEVIFVGLSLPITAKYGYFSVPAIKLLIIATLGNSLGSMVTFLIGHWLPNWSISLKSNKKFQWTKTNLEKFGPLFLLLSWLPIMGDLLCAVAGWLRLNWIYCLIFIMIGKFLRYILLLFLGFNFF